MKLFDLANFGRKAVQSFTTGGNFIWFIGDQGGLNVSINGFLKVMTFDTDITTTVQNFVNDNFDFYKSHGLYLETMGPLLLVYSSYGWWNPNSIQIEISTYVPEEASPTTTAATTTAGGTDLTFVQFTTVDIDFHAARIWRITTDFDTYIMAPVRPKNGDQIRLELTSTEPVEIYFNADWEFIGEVSPFTLTNSAFSVIEGVYDSVKDKVICEITTHSSIITTTLEPPTTTAIPTTTGIVTTIAATTAIPTTTPVGGALRDYDGHIYTTIIVGDQEWIVENLRTTHYEDGTPIPHLPLDADWTVEDGTPGQDGGYCVYDNIPSNAAVLGLLYNWYAIDNGHGLAYFTRNGIKEDGWRVPVSADFDVLFAAIGGKPFAGGTLKSIGTTNWNAPNTGATDFIGFTALGAGLRMYTPPFANYTNAYYDAFFGCSDVFDANNSYCARLVYDSVEAYQTAGSKKHGLSVRCVRDLGTTSPAPTTTGSGTTEPH